MSRSGMVLWLATMSGIAPAVLAQSRPVKASVDTVLTATDNAAHAGADEKRSDLSASVRPAVAWSRSAAGSQLDLDAAVTLLGYTRGTGRGGAYPEARMAWKSALVDRWLLLDADATVRQSQVDPFGTQLDDRSGSNRRTEGTYRLAPRVERRLSPASALMAGYDAAVSTNGAGEGARAIAHRGLFGIGRAPVPWGGGLQWSRLDSRTQGFEQSRLMVETARVSANVAIAGDWVAGLVVGRDRHRFLGTDSSDRLTGVQLRWEPGPRTQLSADLEHRFFGRGGVVALGHRTPFLAFGLAVSRQPVAGSSGVSALGSSSGVRPLLDAILRTRHPAAGERAALVDDLIDSRGLDMRAALPSDIAAPYPQLQSAWRASCAWLGRRDTITLALYSQTLRRLRHDAEAPLVPATGSDGRQQGGALALNHRLSPTWSADVSLRWSRMEGLADRAGEHSREEAVRLSMARRLSPRTGVFAGLERDRFRTDAEGLHPYDATALFVGLNQGF